MPRDSGAWRVWPMVNQALVDELIQRVKFEIDQRSDEDHMFEIGDLHIWFSDEDYSLQRHVGPDTWNRNMILRGEMDTLVFLEWGSEEDAQYAVGVLRQRQVLEDIASV